MSNKIIRRARKIFEEDLDKAEKVILERFTQLVKKPIKKLKSAYKPPTRHQ